MNINHFSNLLKIPRSLNTLSTVEANEVVAYIKVQFKKIKSKFIKYWGKKLLKEDSNYVHRSSVTTNSSSEVGNETNGPPRIRFVLNPCRKTTPINMRWVSFIKMTLKNYWRFTTLHIYEGAPSSLYCHV